MLVVVVVSILSQILKARKEASSGTPAPHQPGEPVSPTTELQEFLKQLSAGDGQTERPVVRNVVRPVQQKRPTPPAPTRPRGRQTRTFEYKVTRRVRETSREVNQPPTLPSAPTLAFASPAPPPPIVQPVEPLSSPPEGTARLATLNALKTRDSLRAAILIREVMGPPVALRKKQPGSLIEAA
jgi:hypothetical protein